VRFFTILRRVPTATIDANTLPQTSRYDTPPTSYAPVTTTVRGCLLRWHLSGPRRHRRQRMRGRFVSDGLVWHAMHATSSYRTHSPLTRTAPPQPTPRRSVTSAWLISLAIPVRCARSPTAQRHCCRPDSLGCPSNEPLEFLCGLPCRSTRCCLLPVGFACCQAPAIRRLRCPSVPLRIC